MKQRITTDQLQQLSMEQRNKLKEWWMPSFGDLFVFEEYCDENLFDSEDEININFFNAKIKPYSLPLLTIGQCFSLLEPYRPNLQKDHVQEDLWTLEIKIDNKSETIIKRDLIDALFEAIKLILV
ncbi:hypothetical protein Desaci_1687 [Desulfosporosinus acidiphilus SJ4]|uniref:Uncharacterized protein n=1 Tax=Desulfosporosinus acidiphilus (strain DSM 22704 / JCM 16185 / SJ4) TaxID=646529 RepID=I4D4F6_DESAJ|nr:hypothetical protein [Desulfosporosinus acidiphilus]AFM40680.1 hypothetical protein Desaci_1687 [Desulfosporosinus acidiphilus SJ4]